MFDFIRNHTRLVLGFLLLLIIPSFVFFGVEGYTSFRDGSSTAVASVGGRSISRGEWDTVHQRQVDQVRREQPQVDSRLLDTPEMRRGTLDAIVRERVLLAAAGDLHLTPTDNRLQRLFLADPQFAPLRNPDGSVNRDLLAAQGLNSELFAQQLRQEFAMRQVLAGVTRTVPSTPAAAAAALDPLMQRREVQLQVFDPNAYRDKINPSPAELEEFYKAQQAQFTAPESAQIEYVMLSLEDVAKTIKPSDDEIRKYFTDNAARFTAPEERRASHILITASRDLPAAERTKAKEKAQGLLAEVRANPAGFADLARKHSQDPGSAQQGGDLDFFPRGAMVKPFEDAAYGMKVGDISEVVESDFGFHIIQLTALRGGEKKPLEAVRAEIEAELRRSLAQRRWPELSEQFSNLVYEQSDSLKAVADKLQLTPQTAQVNRNAAVEGQAPGPLTSAKFLDALFSGESITSKRNTDAVEFATNQFVAGRVLQHNPSRVLPLEEVKDRVRAGLVAQKAAALAVQEGKARLAALQAAPTEALAAAPVTVSRMQPQGLPRPVLDAVLKADAGKLPALAGVDLGAQGYVVLRVTQVLPRETPPEAESGLREQYAQAWAAAEAEAYLGALKRRYKAEVKPAAGSAAPADAPTR
jgi:peptidyl-prolyl cis-trans isomerase D